MTYPPPPGQDPNQPYGQPQYGQQPYPGQQYQQPQYQQGQSGPYGQPQYPGGYPQGPGYPPPPGRSRRNLWIGVSVVAVLAIVGVIAAIGLSGGDDKKSSASSTSSASASTGAKSGSPTPSTKPSTRTSAPEPDDESTSIPGLGGGGAGLGEDNFLSTMHMLLPATKSKSDAELVAQGKQACSDLKSGKTLLETATKVTAVSAIQEKGMLVGAAMPAFCPDQTGKIK
ncbi:DUF732 domain-containing protein [Embleya scabrispora]|uniref:DUF732 domain-containing protein n=1 Tax=Embleya scabrispora TaxID=159449 RepID=UPI0003794793|nr:DUF732 domain-containing protein [Embleya scabrispora]MYS80392.1 DUF732 domain-containing protein [Streptomyces sp. SID5474]